MRTLQHPFFLLCLALGMVNQVLEGNGVYIWPLYAYLDDILCLPLTLTFILAVQRSYFNNQKMIIPFRHIVFAVLAFTFCFELILPLFNETYTADVLDILAYSTGAIGFELMINKPQPAVLVR